MRSSRNILLSIALGALLIAGAFAVGAAFTSPVHAQVSIDFPSNFADFSSQDIKTTISNIVRIVLGFVGIVFLLLLLAGGFIWMTSGGNTDKISRAKKIIASAVIGLLITLSAYAIASFIVRSLNQAVSPGTPTTAGFCGDGRRDPGEQCDDGNTAGGDGCSGICTGEFPPDVAACMNGSEPAPGVVKVCGVSGGHTPAAAVTIVGWHFGVVQNAASKVFFEDPGGTRTEAEIISCGPAGFTWADRKIKVRIPESLTPPTDPTFYKVIVQVDANDDNIINPADGDDDCLSAPNVAGSLGPDFDCKSWDVRNGTEPTIYCLNPGQGTYGDSITVTGRNFGTGGAGDVVRVQSDGSRADVPGANITSWQAEEIAFQIPGPAAPFALSGDVTVAVGGQESNGEFLKVQCTASAQCGSNCCQSGSNACVPASFCSAAVPNGPVITNVVPNDGAQGNLVTVIGNNFGNAPGEIHLIDDNGTGTTFVNPQPSVAACTTSWWKNRQIIVEIPAGAIDSDATIQVFNTTVGLPSNLWTRFVINETVRPGLCLVNPTHGEFNLPFTLAGKNFTGANQKILFGNPASDLQALNPVFSSDTQATGNVPNVQSRDTTIAVNVGTQISNPVEFTVDPEGTNPVIFSVTPTTGADGTYVTIAGSGFGSIPGQVWFVRQGVADVTDIDVGVTHFPADIDFPAMCSTTYWTPGHIIVKAEVSPALPDGNYFLYVRTNDDIYSQPNSYAPGVNAFDDDDSLPLAPGLCKVTPVGGPIGTPVDYFGENFGVPPPNGTVWFDVNAEALYTSPIPNTFIWNNQQALNALVPNNAVTGMTTLRSAAGIVSNPLPFSVGACENDLQCNPGGGTANVCCDGVCQPAGLGCSGTPPDVWALWTFTAGEYDFDLAPPSADCTEDTQSPTPYPYDQLGTYDSADPELNAPRNSVISARFTRDLENVTTIANNVKIFRCNAGPAFNSSQCAAEVTLQGAFDLIGSRAWEWRPAVLLDAATWYEVRLDKGTVPDSNITAEDGSIYHGSQFLGATTALDFDDFRWHFRTRDAAQAQCEVATVGITPNNASPIPDAIAPVGGDSGWMSAVPQNAQCYICGGSYTYVWNVNATYAQQSINDPIADDSRTRFTGIRITEPPVGGTTPVTATLSGAPSGPITSTAADLAVRFIPPKVTKYSPTNDCRETCTNAQPYARFNVSIDTASAGGEITMYRCSTPDCSFADGLTPVALAVGDITWSEERNPNDRVDIDPGILTPNTWYRVAIGDGIRNTQGQNLIGLNFDTTGTNPSCTGAGCDAFSWKFQTSFGACTPDRIDSIPDTATINSLGGAKVFQGLAVDEGGACGEINLNPNAYDWTWTVNPLYASLVPDADANDARQSIEAVQQPPTNPINVTANIAVTPAVTPDNSDLYIFDNRDLLTFIGHSPDFPPGITPPLEASPDGQCDVGGPANQCVVPCSNILVSATFSTHLSNSSLGASLPGGMVAHYPFTNGTAADAVGGNNGTLTPASPNGPTPTASNADVPTLGRGMRFDNAGMPLPAEHIDLGRGSAIKDITGSMTLVAWAQGESRGNYAGSIMGTMDENASSGAAGRGFMLGPDNAGRICFAVAKGANDYKNICEPGQNNPAAWIQWAGVFNADTRTMQIYKNGQLAVSSSTPSVVAQYIGNGLSVKVGNRGDGRPEAYFNGEIDDVRIYGRALTSQEVQTLYAMTQGASSAKFQVYDLTNSRVVQGTVSVRNFSSNPGFCTGLPSKECGANSECDPSAGEGVCSTKRGQILFTPTGGRFDAGAYQVRLCPGTSCTTTPLLSTQGVAYSSGPKIWEFTAGAQICKISFIDIDPNPANFTDRRIECELSAADPLCTDNSPKYIVAQARDATGYPITGVTYTWRKTDASYTSSFYTLAQPTTTANVLHRGVLGVDTNFVTAESTNPATLDVGSGSASGLMRFLFCENPWIGDTGLNAAYYLDAPYNFKLSYCRDAAGANPSDPAGLLPSLPAPHLIRNLPSGQAGASDLLKEHVFVVGTDITGSYALPDGAPRFTAGPDPVPVGPYRLGDYVYFDFTAEDPQGDSFQFTMGPRPGGESDVLPASAHLDPKTGVFSWIVDQMPTTDGRYDVRFSLQPGPDFRDVSITIASQTPPPTLVPPTVVITSAPAGGTVAYGATGSFTANVTSFGSGGATSIRAFVWDFQDSGPTAYPGACASSYCTDHTFLQSGVHQVTFRVQNNLGVWSLPAVVNITVPPKSSAATPLMRLAEAHSDGAPWYHRLVQWFIPVAHGQGALAPSNLVAESTGQVGNVRMDLQWQNNANYDSIIIYKNGTTLTTAVSGSATSYPDGPAGVAVGTEYTYRVCGIIATVEHCAEVVVTARNVDYDVIVARVYKNLDHLSMREWYETYAPNPSGSTRDIVVDGYPAIQDGTTAYIGYANCSTPNDCRSGSIYTNVLLLSVNPNANEKTKRIFEQLIATLRINDGLVVSHDGTGTAEMVWYCSEDDSIACNDGLDEVCRSKNAGVCRHPRAELRRDYERVVELHDIAAQLAGYTNTHKYCADGSNTLTCRTDADCPRNNTGAQIPCRGVYPALRAGSYVGGLTTSKWPSWQDTLGAELASKLPEDPVNEFGANWYVPPPLSCAAFEGHDVNSCWNERDQKFRCHDGSLVYMYQNQGGIDYSLFGQAEATGWSGWQNINPNITLNADPSVAICKDDVAVAAMCGNGVIEAGAGEQCDGGTTYYCDFKFGPGNYNNEFTVGCNPTTCRWADPYAGNAIAAQNACGGSCGNNTRESVEECDGTDGLSGWRCTSGGSIVCSNACYRDCTAGTPYQGTCGNGTIELPEVCDDGSNPLTGNGTTGRCNSQCSGYTSYCGDGAVSPYNQTSIGCRCSAAPADCPAGYHAVKGASCSPTGGCPSGAAGYQYSCVRNMEECDAVNGLTSYSCPAGTNLYCDPVCNRACTQVTVTPATSARRTVPIYEYHFAQGELEDYDYSPSKIADNGYTSKGISFYLEPWTGSCPSGSVAINHFVTQATGQFDRIVRNAGAPSGYSSLAHQPVIGCGYATDRDPAGGSGVCSNDTTDPCNTNADCTSGGTCIQGGISVPVYRFTVTRTLPGGAAYQEFYFSRNPAPRTDITGKAYTRISEIFYAWLGPLQETCGNNVIEGAETCEPDAFATPVPENTSLTSQYACGALFTPNQCRTYGGFCGDGVTNQPFEECDEGRRCKLSGVLCTSNTQCPTPGDSCGGGGLCADPTKTCSTTSDCTGPTHTPGEVCQSGFCVEPGALSCDTDLDCPTTPALQVCVGNAAPCDNSAGNCIECTNACAKKLVPKNFCGDSIVNLGTDRSPANNPGDASEEVCDDGTQNNGQAGACNETCSGQTGSICGNGGVPEAGEVCDDGSSNGTWTFTCSNDATRACDDAADCGGAQCNNTPQPHCSFSCQGPTWAVCGDGWIQDGSAGPDGLPGTGDEVDELCDDGSLNGQPGHCNVSCNNITAAVCGDGTANTGVCAGDGDRCGGSYGPCDDGSQCVNGEMCDPPRTAIAQTCTDTSTGQPGLRMSGCSSSCQSLTTTCHAFGLKIWSDGADVAYLNGRLMTLSTAGAACLIDPAPNGANYSSPDSGNACPAPTEVRNQAWNAPSDARPSNASLVESWEFPDKNVIAVKMWPETQTGTRSFQAVYTSPSSLAAYSTIAGATSQWSCSHVYTPGWNQVNCPDSSSDADSLSDCDPNAPLGTWRRPFTYTGTSNPSFALCAQSYTNFVGGNAQWIWGPTCDPSPGPDVVYCRLEFSSTSSNEAAWNPGYGWVRFATTGSRVTVNLTTGALSGAAWNWNVGWLHFGNTPDRPATLPGGAPAPLPALQSDGDIVGYAWGKNWGFVNLDPKASCGGAGRNCTEGYGSPRRLYKSVRRNAADGLTSGYAWSEKAGWIDFGPYGPGNIYGVYLESQ